MHNPEFVYKTTIQAADSFSIDAFGRWRTSDPLTLFDSKQLYDKAPLYWSEATTGAGTSSTHDTNKASTTIGVSNTTAGSVTRQTKQRFNYQPGKSQLVFVTFSNLLTTTGVTKEVGLFDDDNGLFFRSKDGVVSVVRRTKVSGSVEEEVVPQDKWNIDKMLGTNASLRNLDFSQSQIGVIDFEWLGVGRVRFGWVIGGNIFYCHQHRHANNSPNVYMSTPNLPVRYLIDNDGTGAADTFQHICSSVISEGGQEDTGIIFSKRTLTTQAVSCASGGTIYPIVAVRLKSDRIGSVVNLLKMTMMETSGDDYVWSLHFNPTLSAGLSYSSVHPNSGVEAALGDGVITITGDGLVIDSGLVAQTNQATFGLDSLLKNALRLGVDLDGTRDQIVLAYSGVGDTSTVFATLTWQELS